MSLFWGNPAFHSRQCFVVTACASVLMSSCSIISFFFLSLSPCVSLFCCMVVVVVGRCFKPLCLPPPFFSLFFRFLLALLLVFLTPLSLVLLFVQFVFLFLLLLFVYFVLFFFLFAVYIVLISVCLLIVFLILCSLCRHLYSLCSSFFSLTNLLTVFSIIIIIFLLIFLVSVFCLLLDVCNVLLFLLLPFANRVPVCVHSVQLFFFVFT